jgi:hypothetical protein
VTLASPLGRTARALLVAAIACGCDTAGAAPPADGGAVDFSVGGLSIHFASGAAAVVGGVLTLYLIDLPAACTTVRNVRLGNPPLGALTMLTVRVAAPAESGATATATVIAPTLVPGPGHAAGSLVRTLNAQGGSQTTASFDLATGTIAWTTDSSGNATLTSLDLGFAGTSDRISTQGLYLPACSL